MPERVVKPVNSLLMRIVAKWVKPEVLPSQPQTLIDADIPVMYVLDSGGLFDLTALTILCEKFDLPHPEGNFNYDTLRLRRRSVALKVSPPFGIGKARRSVPKVLQRIIDTALAGDEPSTECQLIPVSVFWGREPQREDSIWRQMFSETWEIAGGTRKLFTTMVHGRHTLVSFGEPLSLNQFIHSSEGLNSERRRRKLSRILRVHFRHRRIATIGPDLSHRRMLINHVLADEGVREAIEHQSATTNKTGAKLQEQASHYAHEIAADVSYRTVRVSQKVLNRLWTNLYDGVEFTGIERLKAVADGREIVYVPCHRSHIDYLLLSYILYTNGFSVPHIAAGINLNMPIVGGILRRGGAFFLRRTFSGNALYAATFNSYLKELIQRGHAIEYFIEGGRSRTGRLLPPRGGMLAMTVQAYLQAHETPVVFVPIYLGYERLLEGKSFTGELAGGKKRKESIFGLLKSLKTLREDYGRVHVNISTPIALDKIITSHRPNWRDESAHESRPAWIKPIVGELSEHIMQRINSAASVTPVSLVATALLATPKASLGKTELQNLILAYNDLISELHQGTEAQTPTMPVAEMIEHTKSLGYLTVVNDKLGEIVSVKPGQIAPITYFRNNIQHLLALPSAIACIFTHRSSITDERIHDVIIPAYSFLQAELFLPNQSSDLALTQALKVMEHQGLVRFTEGEWHRATAGSTEAVVLMHLAQSIMPAVERYYLNTAILASAGRQGMEFKQLSEHCEAVADRLASTHGRDKGDWYDKHVFQRFITTMENTKRLIRDDSDLLTLHTDLRFSEADTRLLLNEQTRHAILAAVNRFCSLES